MRTKWLAAAMAVCALAVLDVAGGHSHADAALPAPRDDAATMPMVAQPADVAGQLSVMTYNVEGLPWPIAHGRPPELERIGDRLAALRRTGEQPHVAMFQEAFIDDAKAIADAAGYRYVAYGPDGEDAGRAPSPAAPLGAGFAAGSSWLKGERIGKWEDSGLMIASDYPIVAVRKMAFPDDACAGYDCLASKGVLVAWMKVPGVARPIAFADTHLNSRRSSGVAFDRADAAQAWQVGAVRGFVTKVVPAADDLVFGGDFNIGRVPGRIAAATIHGGPLPGAQEAIALAGHDGDYAPAEARDFAHVVHHGKDKQYFRTGTGAGADGRLTLRQVWVPFGTERDGSMLSDHMGYVADYSLDARGNRPV